MAVLNIEVQTANRVSVNQLRRIPLLACEMHFQ